MSISKIFIANFVCVLINIKTIENILNRIFILLPRSCPRVGQRGAGGVKNISVGICDGAPSTARSSFIFVGLQWISLWNFETIRGSPMTPKWQKLASLAQEICTL